MTVRELLATVSSRELSEWRAYELKNGPLDNVWRDNATAYLVDLTHMIAYMYSEAHYTDPKNGVKGPVQPPDSYGFPRPEATFHTPEESDESEEDTPNSDQKQIDALNRAIDDRK